MANNPMGDNYDDLVGEVDTKPEQNWDTDPGINPSEYFMLLGSTGRAKPMDYETDLTRDYASPAKWTQYDLEGDIVLSPEVLEKSPGANQVDLQGMSQQDEISVPIRFQEVEGASNFYRGYLRAKDIEEDVKIEIDTPRSLHDVNLGKPYHLSILPQAHQNLT